MTGHHFPFLVIPQEDQGEIVNFEVEFPRNRRFLQGVPFYELEQAGVTVSIAREDNPTQILQFYSGTFVMNSRKMWISRLQKKSSSRLAEIVRILRWNTQLPTKPGWYWLWEEETSVNDGEPAIVEVAEGKFGLEVHFSGTELTKPLKTIGGQWGGPIPLPED